MVALMAVLMAFYSADSWAVVKVFSRAAWLDALLAVWMAWKLAEA